MIQKEDLIIAIKYRVMQKEDEFPELQAPMHTVEKFYKGKSRENIGMLLAIHFPIRDQKLAIATVVAGRKILSTKELTIAQAGTIVELAEAIKGFDFEPDAREICERSGRIAGKKKNPTSR